MICLCQRTKKLQPGHESIEKIYDFDLEVKGQGHTEVMMVPDTSSHGDTPMCQIWYTYVKEQRSYSPDTNLHRQTDRRTDGRTDRRTDGRTDRVIPIYPPPQKKNFVCGGITRGPRGLNGHLRDKNPLVDCSSTDFIFIYNFCGYLLNNLAQPI